MRALAIGLALSVGAVAALAWIASPDPLAPGPAPSSVERAPEPIIVASAASERIEVARTEPIAIVYGPTAWLEPQPAALEAPRDVVATARAHFHAQVRVEELARDLPSGADGSESFRAQHPDYVAALDEFTATYVPFAAIQPPEASEPLPALDLWAKDERLARVYRGLSREELLLEHWRIERAAYAESKRVLDERLAHGPYDVRRRDGPIADG